MTQTVPATCVLGPGKTGLTIGLRVLNLDGTTYSAFSTMDVAETSTAGTYRKAGGVVVPDAGGYIVWGVSGTDYAEATVESTSANVTMSASVALSGRLAEYADLPAAAPTAAAVADAVWDEAISGHLTSDTTGAKLNTAASGGASAGSTAYTNSGTRAGMANILTRWRRMVNDSAGSVWTDAQALTLLDSYRTDLWQIQLTPVPQLVGSATVYQVHALGWENVEDGGLGGTAVFRMHDTSGSVIGTSSFTADYQRGIFTFTADQKGSARYVDARSYDLNMAAADGWRELMASKASLYRFTADGASYDRNQWFDHCKAMAIYYDGLSKPVVTTLSRTDLA